MTSGSSWTRGAESAIPGQRRAEDDRTGTRSGGDNRGAWPADDEPADASGRDQDNESDAATSLRSGGLPRWRDRGKPKQAEPEPSSAQHLGDEDYFSYLRGDD